MRDAGCGRSGDHPQLDAAAVELRTGIGCPLGDRRELCRQRAVGVRGEQEDRLEIGACGTEQRQPVGLGAGVGFLVGLDAPRLVGLRGDRREHAEPRARRAAGGLVFLCDDVDGRRRIGREDAGGTPLGELRPRPGVAILVGHRFRQHEVDDIVRVPRRVATALFGRDDVVRRRDQRAETVGLAVALPTEGHDEVRGSHELS